MRNYVHAECLSSLPIAYGSIRMELVFMILGAISSHGKRCRFLLTNQSIFCSRYA